MRREERPLLLDTRRDTRREYLHLMKGGTVKKKTEKKKREEENGGNERRYISSCKTTVNSSMSEYNPSITSIKRRGKREER